GKWALSAPELRVLDGDPRGQARVAQHEGDVRLEALASRELLYLGEEEGSDVLPLDVRLGRGVQRALDGCPNYGPVHRVLLGHRIRHDRPASEAQVPFHLEQAGDSGGAVGPLDEAEPGAAGVEGGELVRSEADDGHSLGLEILEGLRQIE